MCSSDVYICMGVKMLLHTPAAGALSSLTFRRTEQVVIEVTALADVHSCICDVAAWDMYCVCNELPPTRLL
jgi:hypothetical protein